MRWQNDNLEHWLRRACSGDQRAWEQLVDRFGALAFSVARRVGLNDDDASDVHQSVFLALYRNLDRIEDAKSLPRWIATTASREAIRLKRLRSRTINESALAETVSLEDLLASEEAEAETLAEEGASAHQARLALQNLQERCRELASPLYDDEEPSYAEISERLGLPIGAIGPNRARCLDKLRKLLSKEGFFQ
ncbi:MAG TPA: sigma-70 family RNA polymerase sigma factor [Fimbriimonadaceae bacterium]|nr:sigma-70 family RNA polymerase sigma factor [Fimbriimonadaceae bacterium]